MPLRFAANISTMFAENGNLPKRYDAAKSFGFSAVECQFPYEFPIALLEESKTASGVEHVLLNSYKGSSEDEFGFALMSEDKFNQSLDITLEYADRLKCKCVHVIAGICDEKMDFNQLESNYIHNLKHTASLFEKHDIIGVIEPLCKEVKPNYFLSSFSKAIEYVKAVNSQHLKLLMDVFHLQMIHGNLVNNIKAALPYIGHVQISQAPNRHEPNAAGEVNYKYILSVLDSIGYDGWVGLEYFPSESTEKSLSWIKEYGYCL